MQCISAINSTTLLLRAGCPFVFFFWHQELLQNCVASTLGDSRRNHHSLTIFVRGFVVKSGDWRESAYWICTFSNSQWHVQAELGNGRCDLNHPESRVWSLKVFINLWGNGFNRKLRCRHIYLFLTDFSWLEFVHMVAISCQSGGKIHRFIWHSTAQSAVALRWSSMSKFFPCSGFGAFLKFIRRSISHGSDVPEQHRLRGEISCLVGFSGFPFRSCCHGCFLEKWNLQLQKTRGDWGPDGVFQGLLLCTATGVLQEGRAGTDVAVAVAKQVKDLDTRSAEATSEDDRVMIHSLIEQMPGGFDRMNTFIRETIRLALENSHEHYEDAFTHLMHELSSIPTGSTWSPRLPTLLTDRCHETYEISRPVGPKPWFST